MVSKTLILLVATAVYAQNECQRGRLECVKSGACTAQGANLGSWFLAESWMNPGIFNNNGCNMANDGQWLLEQCLGDNKWNVLEAHWSSWVTEDDFRIMSERGVNIVRIPVGWWQIYDDVGGANNANLHYNIEPKDYAVGSLKYLDKAFQWGKQYGVGVLVDLHAAPGSQNGEAHSSPPSIGVSDWAIYQENIGQSVDSMELYAERYCGEEALVGFGLINEPKNIDTGVLQDYYRRAYDAIRRHSDAWIVINPLINNQDIDQAEWTNFMNPDQGYYKVAMDAHWYSCFGEDSDQNTAEGDIGYINYDRLNALNNYNSVNPKPLFIGEWSGCWHVADNDRIGEFIRAQVNVYNNAGFGWTFWSWAPDTSGNPWSFHTAFDEGWIGNLDWPC